MVLLIDANVVLDYILNREPFCTNAANIMKICAQKEHTGYIALHSVSIIWYVLRKMPDNLKREWIKQILNVLQVTGIQHEDVLKAISMDSFPDFEDCLQDRCAEAVNASYIITNNIKDFSEASTKAITPEVFCSTFFPELSI